jgi:uncharacterized protein (DUF302 family)
MTCEGCHDTRPCTKCGAPGIDPAVHGHLSLEGSMTIRNGIVAVIFAIALSWVPQLASAEDSGLITKPSKYSVPDTIERFEVAVKAKGWVVFTRLDHAAAAAKVGLQLPPRTVVVYGNPKLGTGPMQKAPTLAIDNPPKALVWQDDHGKVWLTYNTADYIAGHVYPRHGLTISDEGRKQYEEFLDALTDQATK